MSETLVIRKANDADMGAITRIYNQGIEDRIATLEADRKTESQVRELLGRQSERYDVIVAQRGSEVVGWAALNPYSHRCAYDGVADLSVYVERSARGSGIGELLLDDIEGRARRHNFHKIVLFTFPFNEAGQALYRKRGFREVGTFEDQGTLDGRFIDVMAMEKLLR